MRIVSTNYLKPGMKLGKAVYSPSGYILLNKGVLLTESFIKNLKDKNIPAAYIDDEISQGVEIKEAIDLELKVQAVGNIKSIFENLSHISTKSKDPDKTRFVSPDAYDDMKDIINMIINNLTKNKGNMFNMVEVMSTDLATYTHCVNVAVLSILTGRALEFSENHLVDLGTGALMHDMGMIRIPHEIVNKPDKLTKEEFEKIKKHPMLGYEMIKDSRLISAFVKTIVLMHHERLDGSGYPLGSKGNDINKFVRVVSVCDMFDALISTRAHRSKLPVYTALELINSFLITKLDENVYNAFIKNIAVYPVGVGVLLNTKQKALVIGTNKEHPTRPKVRIVYNEDGSFYPGFKIVDLMKELTLFIEDTCALN